MNVFMQMIIDTLHTANDKLDDINECDNNKDKFIDGSCKLYDLMNIENYKYAIYFRSPYCRHTLYNKICHFVVGGTDKLCMQTLSDMQYRSHLANGDVCDKLSELSVEYKIVSYCNSYKLDLYSGSFDILLEKVDRKRYKINLSTNPIIDMSFYIYYLDDEFSLTTPSINIAKDDLQCLLISSYFKKKIK